MEHEVAICHVSHTLVGYLGKNPDCPRNPGLGIKDSFFVIVKTIYFMEIHVIDTFELAMDRAQDKAWDPGLGARTRGWCQDNSQVQSKDQNQAQRWVPGAEPGPEVGARTRARPRGGCQDQS